MLLNRTGGGGENVTPQLDTQESLLEQIKEILPFKGTSGVEWGEVTYETDMSSITVEHHLGVKPTLVLIAPKENYNHASYRTAFVMESNSSLTASGNNPYASGYNSGSGNLFGFGTTMCTRTTNSVTFKPLSTQFPFSKGTYLWIVFA